MCNICLQTALKKQAAKVDSLEKELAIYIADGNEYYSEQLRDEIVIAKSPARLIHLFHVKNK